MRHHADPAAVRRVFGQLMDCHESLRTAFKTVDHQPRQFIRRDLDVPFETVDISTMAPAERPARRDLLYSRLAARPFDLSEAPLFRVKLVKLEPTYYHLMFNMHHIVSDGWSLEVLKKEFIQLYEESRAGRELRLDPLPVQYKDFAQWHHRQLTGPEGKESSRYWKEKLAPGIPILQLPGGDPSADRDDNTGAAYRFMIDEETKERLKKLARDNQTTLFTVLFSAYILLLRQLTGEPDIACSIIAAGREHPSLHRIIGFFTNVVIFNIHTQNNEPFETFLKRVNGGVVETFRHQSYPLEPVFEELGERYPDIPVSFNLLSMGDTAGRELEPFTPSHPGQVQDVKFDLEPYVTEYRNGIDMYWAYKKSMFHPAAVESMVKQYIELLDAILDDRYRAADIFNKRRRAAAPVIENRAGYAAPGNDVQRKLVDIWSGVLGIDKQSIGIDHDFFQLGGHSLKATVMTSKIHKETDVLLPLKEVFKNPTVRNLSRLVEEAEKERFVPIEPAGEKTYYPVSSAQKRFFFLQQMEPGSTAYNIHRTIKLEGPLERRRIEGAFKKLVDRHESLRTSFEIIAGQLVQKIHPQVEFEIREAAPPAPFDLSRAPLLRVGLEKIETETHILMFDMHHIVSDGSSMAIFVKDLLAFYTGTERPPLELQYKDFSQWQNSQLASGRLKEQEQYWLGHFSGELPVLEMPVDYTRPPVRSFEGDRIAFHFEEELTRDLRQWMKESGATLYMVLLALYNVLLSKCGGRQDIVVGTPTAGRNHPGLENIIGLLIETIAVRNYPVFDKTINEFLAEVKENTLNAYENQSYPFGELIGRKGVENDYSRNPLFDTMLIVQNIDTLTEEDAQVAGGLRAVPREAVNKVSKVDLTLEAVERESGIFFHLEYCTALFKRETAERFIDYFKRIAMAAAADKEIKLKDIEHY